VSAPYESCGPDCRYVSTGLDDASGREHDDCPVEPTAYPFGTTAKMSHGDFAPALLEGTQVVILRRHPDSRYDYEVAYINADTSEAETSALNEVDLDVEDVA
jgi:hypothetical protein